LLRNLIDHNDLTQWEIAEWDGKRARALLDRHT
jgi:hypothetical protein